MNQCSFTGRMVRDAEDIKGDGVRFTVAVDIYNYSTRAREAVFVPFVAFGKVVPVIKQYAPRGKEVCVTGEYRTREFTPASGPNAGTKVKDHSFHVDKFELLSGSPKSENAGTFGGPADEASDEAGGW